MPSCPGHPADLTLRLCKGFALKASQVGFSELDVVLEDGRRCAECCQHCGNASTGSNAKSPAESTEREVLQAAMNDQGNC
eukprot:6196486-Pleurochrysis_carterae.AAC.1